LRPLLCLPLHSHPHTPHLHSFPPRRSSDLFTPYLTVDESLDASTLVNYGLSMNQMSPSAITSFTIPNNGTGVTAGGASVVWPDEEGLAKMRTAMEEGSMAEFVEDLEKRMEEERLTPEAPSDVESIEEEEGTVSEDQQL